MPTTETKACNVCGHTKPLTTYQRITNSRGQTYHRRTCKPCWNIAHRNPNYTPIYNDGHTKECGTCHVVKPYDQFGRKNGKIKGKCKECYNTYYREYFANKDNMAKQVARARRRKTEMGPVAFRARQHGLTEAQYYELYNKYDGKCWICKTREATTIDHDHACCDKAYGCAKCVRGVLCGLCNSMLGLARDEEQNLINADEYLLLSEKDAEDL